MSTFIAAGGRPDIHIGAYTVAVKQRLAEGERRVVHYLSYIILSYLYIYVYLY